MYDVEFPGLGLEFKINPVAFQLWGHSFTWYGIIIGLAFITAFLYAMASCRKMHIDQDKLIDAVIVGMIGGIVGARLYYVLFFAGDQYLKNPISILYIWEGGLGIYGGLIGGALCGALIAKLHKLSVPAVLDLSSLGFLIGQSIGRWGNFTNQEAFGTATTLPWRMVSGNTDAISSSGVHPCFLYESLWCLIGFVLLHIFSRKFRRYDGQVFLLYIVWYGIGRFFIEGLRTDSLVTPFLYLRISQVVAALSVLAAAVLLILFRKRTSLTGCGSAKIMELNAIVDEAVPKKVKKDSAVETLIEEDGSSTIFENAEDAKKALHGGSIRESGSAPAETNDASEKTDVDKTETEENVENNTQNASEEKSAAEDAENKNLEISEEKKQDGGDH